MTRPRVPPDESRLFLRFEGADASEYAVPHEAARMRRECIRVLEEAGVIYSSDPKLAGRYEREAQAHADDPGWQARAFSSVLNHFFAEYWRDNEELLIGAFRYGRDRSARRAGQKEGQRTKKDEGEAAGIGKIRKLLNEVPAGRGRAGIIARRTGLTPGYVRAVIKRLSL